MFHRPLALLLVPGLLLLGTGAARAEEAAPAPAVQAATTGVRSFVVSTSIRASQETLWTLLTHAPGYPAWNPTVEKIEGEIQAGSHIKVWPKAMPGQAFDLNVETFVAGERMVWAGGMPLGLFRAERTYVLTPQADGTVNFTMRETFSGPFAGMIAPSMPDLQPSFDAFAAALKQAAEPKN